MSIEDRIRPVIFEVYGDSNFVRAFVVHLAGKIDEWDNRRWDWLRSREDMIFRTCWDWFSGGSTAEDAARRIEAVL